MADNKKQPGFYDRTGEQSNTNENKTKSKEARGNDNICNKCSKFDKKTIDSCKCSSKYRGGIRNINKI